MWWNVFIIGFFVTSNFTTDWKVSKEMAKMKRSQHKIQKKRSKKCKELNKLKQLKISDDIKKILEYELSKKRASYDRTMNKSKGITKPY